MQAEAEAAAQRVGPAGALPDPVLRVELMNINNYGNDASPSLLPWKVGETKYTLMQSLPLWGKRELKRDAASADARQADAAATPPGPNWRRASSHLRRVLPRCGQRAAFERSARPDGAPGAGLRRRATRVDWPASRTRSAPSWSRRRCARS
jgi:cobalt-zinc-cadmium efflux system outer membrane protein